MSADAIEVFMMMLFFMVIYSLLTFIQNEYFNDDKYT